MDFVFQGFQSTLPVWVYILLIFAAGLLSWWSYQSYRSVSPALRYVLIGLRSAVFFLLLIILLNPFYKAESTYLDNPRILVFLDNSESTTLAKGRYNGLDSYRQVLDVLNLTDSSDVDFEIYSMGRQVKLIKPDSLTFNEERTNLFDPVLTIKDREEDISGTIFISDGIFNQGKNPFFQAEELSTPIFTIGLGNTTRQKDLIVEEVETSATGYLNSLHALEVSIINNGFKGRPIEVRIMKEDDLLKSKTINPGQDKSLHSLNFEIELTEEGLQQYRVVIPALDNEWTSANNEQSFAIDVLDQKQQILSLAFEIHPDVKFIRSLLASDRNTVMYKRTWLQGSRFMEAPLNIAADSLDLIIIQGTPPPSMNRQIKDLTDQVPFIFMNTPGSNLGSSQILTEMSLPVTLISNITVEQVNILNSLQPTEHPVMELPEISYSRLPPLFAPVNGLETAPGGTMLFESTFMGQKTQKPVISVQELGNRRLTFISAYGWFRITQTENAEIRTFVRTLFDHIISWTISRPDNRKLRIQPAKKVFTGNETITLNGFLQNESGETESNASINITLDGENIEDRFYSMDNRGDGQYRLNIGTLPEGIYTYTATAKKGERVIDEAKGNFSVSKSNTEFVNTVRDDQLLKQLAFGTGGNYLPFNETEHLWDSLKTKGMLDKEEKVSETLFFPHQHSFWFILVILLLGTEWVIRKYLALP